MSAGTVSITNGSRNVGGSATTFSAELKAGDFIVMVIGGVTYTLPVEAVTSDTQLTLVSPFNGPTSTGLAWWAVPRKMQNTITAEIVAQATEALRKSNTNENNWRALLTATGNVTLFFDDGSEVSGPSWAEIVKQLGDKVDASQLQNKVDKTDMVKYMSVCESVDELRTKKGTVTGQQIYVKSYHQGKNLGGGIFLWSADSVKQDDAGIYISATDSANGRWIRQYDGTRRPEYFGAYLDGVTPDGDALQKMADSANNSPTLAENFFGAFDLKNRSMVLDRTINFGRPIFVEAYGGRFIVKGAFNAVNFSMHNGVWRGGYFDYTQVANDDINSQAVAMLLATENNPIQVMASTISHVRIWGAHTGIKFDNANTDLWMFHLDNIQAHVRSGSSSTIAHGYYLNSGNGVGGSTTHRLTDCHVAGYGDKPGAGLKGWYLHSQNDVIMTNIAYDWYDVSPDVARKVGEKHIIDATVMSLTITGMHTEQLVNDTSTFGISPFYFNTNSLRLDGFEMLLTGHTNTAAWVWLAGNGTAVIDRWHDVPKAGQTKGHVLNLAGADSSLQIFSTGSVRSAQIIGAKTRMNIAIAGEKTDFGVEYDTVVTSGQAIYPLPTDVSLLKLSVVGEVVPDGTQVFGAEPLLIRDALGAWNIIPNIIKTPNYQPASIGLTVAGGNLVMTADNSLQHRVQTRTEWRRGKVSAL